MSSESTSPVRILVVDDEPSIVDSVSTVLRYEGFEVDVANSGRGALKKAQDSPFDLIVLDVMLPDLNGLEVTRRMPSAIGDGYSSFKVFMTYEGLALTDEEILKVMTVARGTGALVMVHAENYDIIRHLTAKLESEGKIAPRFHATSRPIPAQKVFTAAPCGPPPCAGWKANSSPAPSA